MSDTEVKSVPDDAGFFFQLRQVTLWRCFQLMRHKFNISVKFRWKNEVSSDVHLEILKMKQRPQVVTLYIAAHFRCT